MGTPQQILVAVDAVVFGYTPDRGISVLLIQRKFDPFMGSWALPGGFVKPDEPLEKAVERELKEETGIIIQYLEQLYTFGRPDRDPRQRIISVAYYALVRPETFVVHANSDAADVAWFDVNDLPALAFDHAHILQVAIQRLRNKITYEPIGFDLLPPTFTFSELQRLYETLLERDIDRGNFQKKIKSLGILEPVSGARKQAGSGRPAKLYRFHPDRYQAQKEKVIMFEIWNQRE